LKVIGNVLIIIKILKYYLKTKKIG